MLLRWMKGWMREGGKGLIIKEVVIQVSSAGFEGSSNPRKHLTQNHSLTLSKHLAKQHFSTTLLYGTCFGGGLTTIPSGHCQFYTHTSLYTRLWPTCLSPRNLCIFPLTLTRPATHYPLKPHRKIGSKSERAKYIPPKPR